MKDLINPKAIYEITKEWITRKEDHAQYAGVLAFVIVIQLIVLAIPTVIIYKLVASEPFFNYSNGTMKAKSAKISAKGIIWTTNDGYILTGSMSEGVAEKWEFSTREDSVIKCIKNNDIVELTYKQYALVPYSIGSTSHLVTECKGL